MARYTLKLNKEYEECISNIVNNLYVKGGVRFKKAEILARALALLGHTSSMDNKGYSLLLYNPKTNKIHNKISNMPGTGEPEKGFIKRGISKIVGKISMKKYILTLNEKSEECISEIVSNLYVMRGVRLKRGEVISSALTILDYVSSMANEGYSLYLYDPKTNKVHQEIIF
ncbi:MAG: hypothetical protein KAT28_05770 [Candidatus Aenigmarchaeota archaeon]|nr:hypothetical protein [Candidatus Aenigmarchaeota archaeon]